LERAYAKKGEGVSEVTTPEGNLPPQKTVTCGHCQRLVFVQPGGDGTGSLAVLYDLLGRRMDPPSVCHRCWSLICPQCHAVGTCTPWEAQMAAMEARDRFLRSAGLSGDA
jgi:hypothetical protein